MHFNSGALSTLSRFSKKSSIINLLIWSLGLLTACGKDEVTGVPSRTPTIIAFDHVNGSGIIRIELIDQDRAFLNDLIVSVSSTISDYGPGVEYETNETTAFQYADFSFPRLKTIRVRGEGKLVELGVDELVWETRGPGRSLEFNYSALYLTVLETRSNPLFK